MSLRCVGVVGPSGAGKTTLLEAVLPHLVARGLRVLAVKHSGHPHPLDVPGSDSARLARTGVLASAFATPQGIRLQLAGDGAPALAQLRAVALALDVELVVAEGWSRAPWPKLELFRPEVCATRLEAGLGIACIAAAEPPPGPPAVPWIALDDPPALADALWRIAGPWPG